MIAYILIMLVLGQVIIGILQALPPLVIIGIGLMITAFVYTLILRLTAFLPGIAAGKRIGMSEGFSETRALGTQIFIAALLVLLVDMAAGYGVRFVYINLELGASYPYAMLAQQWLTSMLMLSLLTTIYGHGIEGKPLNS